MKKYTAVLIMIFIAACAGNARASDKSHIPFKVDDDMAQRMVMDINNSSPENAGNYLLTQPWDPPFIYYEWLGIHRTALGWFDVNPWTGDVWDIVSCKHLSTPALERDRAEIRQTFTAQEMKQYKKLAAIRPACWN